MPAAIFGITDDTLNLVVNLLLLFLVVMWLALVAWTYFDAGRRIEDRFLVLCAATASFVFPYLGTVVYSILRPPEFLADQHERELEIRASELRLRQLEEQSCPNCEHPVERNFLRCPNCRARIKDPCESCGKPIDPRWSVCPYCETPVRRAAAERRPDAKRRARSRASEAPPERGARDPRPSGSEGEPRQPAARATDGRKGAKPGRPGRGSRSEQPQVRKPRTSS
ncbi:MAG TPA: zinc ribbon domain-containing protein [Solirubrobacterales bacterium]|nr:zinc ribbon domain-containing protein [Solirubrobacterales bacterium]